MTEPFLYWYRGTVFNVVDGDTVDIDIDLGFHIHWKTRFRLYGINTPERGQPNWAEATQYVKNKVLNKDVIVHTFMDKGDKYGRFLATILYEESHNLNQELIDAGLAVPYIV
jgi:micrococcal nuclease